MTWNAICLYSAMIIMNIIPQLIYIGLIVGVFIAYNDTIRINKGEPSQKKSEKGLLSKEFPKFKQYNKAMNNPGYLIAVFVVIGMILGATSGIWYYYSYKNPVWLSDGDGGDSELIYDIDTETITETTVNGDYLDEGDSDTTEIELNYLLIHNVEIVMTWRDEPDQNRYENTPDTFTLSAELFNDAAWSRDNVETASNERNEEGMISLQFSFDENDFFIGTSLKLTVTLDEAGDYDPWIGPGLIIRTDPGNDYEITTMVEYQNDEFSE